MKKARKNAVRATINICNTRREPSPIFGPDAVRILVKTAVKSADRVHSEEKVAGQVRGQVAEVAVGRVAVPGLVQAQAQVREALVAEAVVQAAQVREDAVVVALVVGEVLEAVVPVAAVAAVPVAQDQEEAPVAVAAVPVADLDQVVVQVQEEVEEVAPAAGLVQAVLDREVVPVVEAVVAGLAVGLDPEAVAGLVAAAVAVVVVARNQAAAGATVRRRPTVSGRSLRSAKSSSVS